MGCCDGEMAPCCELNCSIQVPHSQTHRPHVCIFGGVHLARSLFRLLQDPMEDLPPVVWAPWDPLWEDTLGPSRGAWSGCCSSSSSGNRKGHSKTGFSALIHGDHLGFFLLLFLHHSHAHSLFPSLLSHPFFSSSFHRSSSIAHSLSPLLPHPRPPNRSYSSTRLPPLLLSTNRFRTC